MDAEWIGEVPTLALHSDCLFLSRNQKPVLHDDASPICTTEIRTNMISAAEASESECQHRRVFVDN